MPAYKDSATGKWYCKFYYSDYEGNKKQKLKRGFERKKDAQEYERSFLENQQFQPDMPLEVFVELYKKDKYPQLRLTTITGKDAKLEKIVPYFADKPLNSIKAKDIKQWQNNMIEENFRSSYIKSIQSQMSAVFNHAIKFYGLKDNPCNLAGQVNIPDEKPTKMRFWTFSEFSHVIGQINDLKAKTAINLLYFSGMRKGELYALTWEKIDLEKKTVLIDSSFQRIERKDIITHTKTYENRKIQIPETTVQQLLEYKESCYNTESGAIVFPWSSTFIRDAMKEGAEKAGVENIHIHGLRHSHASYLISKGVNVVLVSKRLGHKDVSMTLNTYSHFFPTEEDNLIQLINEDTEKMDSY